MPTCPQCHQAVTTQAIICTACGVVLKAHGHPGIDLYRAQGSSVLCDSCMYHRDNSCNFPQRTQAMTCTLYQDIAMAQTSRLSAVEIYGLPWWRQYPGWIVLGIVMAISFIVVLL